MLQQRIQQCLQAAAHNIIQREVMKVKRLRAT
jgi:hypothetical protein